jgi:hypothetical protein
MPDGSSSSADFTPGVEDGESTSKAERSLLNALGWKNWDVRVLPAENGVEAVEVGGHITGYLNPGSGRLKDRFVDKRLVDDFGVSSIDELSEGELAEYLAPAEGYVTYLYMGDDLLNFDQFRIAHCIHRRSLVMSGSECL